jgi:steroid delta-isomerase-like uncharacterized protein
VGIVTPTDVVLSYLAAFASGDADAVISLVTDDFANEHTSALGSSCHGKAEYSARVPAFLASMPGLRYEVEDVIADAERVVAAYTMRTQFNDRDIAIRGVMRFVVRGDLIAQRTDYWDSLLFKQQAGVQ